jgi:hypothetical protein
LRVHEGVRSDDLAGDDESESVAYAKDELRAKLASVFMANELDIPADIGLMQTTSKDGCNRLTRYFSS